MTYLFQVEQAKAIILCEEFCYVSLHIDEIEISYSGSVKLSTLLRLTKQHLIILSSMTQVVITLLLMSADRFYLIMRI